MYGIMELELETNFVEGQSHKKYNILQEDEKQNSQGNNGINIYLEGK